MTKKKNILILGCSTGIGLAIVRSLVEEKFNVLAVSRTKPDLNCDFFKLDINNIDLHCQLREYIIQKNFSIDGFILNAGISSSPLKNKNISKIQTPKEFNKILQTNLISIYSLIFELESVLASKSSIVFISSIGAHMAFPFNTGYQASKAGIEAISRSLALQLAYKGIRANSLALGYFKTQMTKISYDEENLRAERSNRTLLGRWGEPDEVVGAVNFLLSDKSSYVTGSTLTIDGGWMSKGL